MADCIEVLDKICGSGKTTELFKWMNEQPNEKWMYITPLLSEIDVRMPKEVPDLEFFTPQSWYYNKDDKMTKSEHLLLLLNRGVNVAFTHALFRMLSKDHIEAVRKNGYNLVIDEECSLIESASNEFTKGDIDHLLKTGCIEIQKDNLGMVVWKDSDVTPDGDWKYKEMKVLADLQMLYCAKRDHGMITVHLPITMVSCAKRVILSSYLFDGSSMSAFVQMKGMSVVPFTDVCVDDAGKKWALQNLIEIVRPRNEKVLDEIGLSHTQSKALSEKNLELLQKAMYSVTYNNKAKATDIMWTSRKDVAFHEKGFPKLKAKGMPVDECFVSCNARATNDYAHKWMLLHLYDRHPHQALKAYLEDYGFPIDRDRYALAELIQWVFRSRIRKGEPIKLAIFSKRMRTIFMNWLYNEEQ